MRTKVWVVSTVVVALIGGGLFASNMAFKIYERLEKQGMAGSRTGSQMIGLPYRQQVGLNNALDLINDIGGTGVISQVSQYDQRTDAFAAYSGTSGAAFPLVPGEAYLVQLSSGAPATIDYFILGSENRGVGLNLRAQGSPLGAATLDGPTPREDVSKTGAQFKNIPPASACFNAKDLIDDLEAFATGAKAPILACASAPVPPVACSFALPRCTVVQVGTYLSTVDAVAGYTGLTGTPFPIPPAGGPVLIQVNEDLNCWPPC